jgi:hypothetical protein
MSFIYKFAIFFSFFFIFSYFCSSEIIKTEIKPVDDIFLKLSRTYNFSHDLVSILSLESIIEMENIIHFYYYSNKTNVAQYEGDLIILEDFRREVEIFKKDNDNLFIIKLIFKKIYNFLFDDNLYYIFELSYPLSWDALNETFYLKRENYLSNKISEQEFKSSILIYKKIENEKKNVLDFTKKTWSYNLNKNYTEVNTNLFEVYTPNIFFFILFYYMILCPFILFISQLAKILKSILFIISFELFLLVYVKLIFFSHYFCNNFTIICLSLFETLFCYFYPGNIYEHLKFVIKHFINSLRIF